MRFSYREVQKMGDDVTVACRDISELTPAAQTACRLFMERCAKAGYDIFITETYRSQERQDYLYTLGRVRSGNIVTWTHNSRHTSRRAWDIACRGGDLYNAAVLAGCGRVAAELGITWGGTWKSSPDMPHFEVSSDWVYKGDDEPMTEAEKAKMQAIDDSLTNLYSIVEGMKKDAPAVYDYIDGNMPEWARPTVQKLVERGTIKGDEHGRLGLTEEMLRLLVWHDREGLYG